jgi:hypothetical protein
LLLAGARASTHAGNFALAKQQFEDLVRAYEDRPALRNEFASVLSSAKRYQEAVPGYDSSEPNKDCRKTGVACIVTAGRFTPFQSLVVLEEADHHFIPVLLAPGIYLFGSGLFGLARELS